MASCCSQACFNCNYCLIGGPIAVICMPICVNANCEGGFAEHGEWKAQCTLAINDITHC